jgi:hypothetical protein
VQWDAVEAAFKEFGVDNIGGLTVGNEYLLNSYGTTGGLVGQFHLAHLN